MPDFIPRHEYGGGYQIGHGTQYGIFYHYFSSTNPPIFIIIWINFRILIYYVYKSH